MYKCAYEECSRTVWPTKYNYDKLAKCHNNDGGGFLPNLSLLAMNTWRRRADRIRFAHVLLVNNPNHDNGHGNLCRMSFYASIY